jgi:hypothetical protein
MNSSAMAIRPGAWSSSTCAYARPAMTSEWTAAPGGLPYLQGYGRRGPEASP